MRRACEAWLIIFFTENTQNVFCVPVAPIKALCGERYSDWKGKFEPFGLRVMELTGDTDNDDFYLLQTVNIILTTPVGHNTSDKTKLLYKHE